MEDGDTGMARHLPDNHTAFRRVWRTVQQHQSHATTNVSSYTDIGAAVYLSYHTHSRTPP